jgi:large subunit ribosomal protein L24
MKIKKNDTVQIIHGKDRGKKGKVLQVFPKDNKIVVEGINMMAKNVRPKKMVKRARWSDITPRLTGPMH